MGFGNRYSIAQAVMPGLFQHDAFSSCSSFAGKTCESMPGGEMDLADQVGE
jgi:hypothetical protein